MMTATRSYNGTFTEVQNILRKHAGELVDRKIKELRPFPRNARRHSRKQIKQVAESIRAFGFTNPVLIDEEGVILSGHCRVEAARLLELIEVPTRELKGLSRSEKRALVIAENRLAMNASWDEVYLAEELGILAEDPEIDVAITGFELAEIDQIIDLGGIDPETEVEEDEIVPHLPNASQVVTKSGDIWLLGDHRLLCTDGLNRDAYLKLMENGSTCQGRELAQMVFTDPPYNVPIAGHVTGNVNTRHPEFAMASGEMSSEQFTGFLGTIFSHLAEYTEDGSIHYVCMDWRHQRELLEAAAAIYGTPKNLCVWVKDNGGMGSFYRSRHELVYVFKKGDLPHINNFELGQHGRYRTNVWNYRGVSSGSRQAREELSLHPTVKPVAMVADAILDCSKRGGIILDPFCGSGTILIACEKTGRKARAIEIDPLYCDRAVMRWQSFAHGEAVLAETGESFSEVCDKRRKEACLQTNMDEALSNEGKRRLERNSKEAGSRNGETGLVTVNPKFTKPSPWSAPLNSK